jgi:integrase
VAAWDEDQVDVFLATIEGHRWAAPLRLAVLYGVRRSELLALKWDDVDFDRRTITVDEGLVEVHGGRCGQKERRLVHAAPLASTPTRPITSRRTVRSSDASA